MTILITICARGGSKGLPGKNIKELNGFPLIAYSIHHAQLFAETYQAKIVLSTDDSAIKKAAEDYGLRTEYIRPDYLGEDHVGKIEVLNHIWRFQENKMGIKYDYILDLDVSAPLRSLHDLSTAFERIRNDKNAVNLFSVSIANKNPYFNMVEKSEDGYAVICKPKENVYLSRQSTPEVYELNASFYFYKRSFFTQGLTSAIQDNKSLIYLMDHICFDIDHEVDFHFMKYLLEKNLLDFDLALPQ